MASFATATDLAERLKRTFTTAEVAQAELLLAGATAHIRAVADQWISFVEDDVVTVNAPVSRDLWLPQRPVVAVSSVKVDDVTVTDWKLSGSRLRKLDRDDVWATLCEEHEVEVTYTHGYDVGADGLDLAKSACLAMAAQEMKNPAGLKSRRIDDYAETFGESGETSGFLEKAILKQYGKRPRTGSINTAA